MKYPRITLISVSICLALLLSGCGGGTANSASDASAPASSAPAAATGGWETSDMELASQDSVEKYQTSSVYQNSDAKLIREASLNVQTTQFDQALADLEQLVTQLGGYFQDAAVYGGSYRDVNANRSGEYTIRVPAEQYGQCLNRTGSLGYVTYKNETTENIGEQYYDTEARLKTQQTKQERLQALLEKAGTMEDIISLESALSDVEYEIEQLSSTLKRYDSLIGFATIHLSLEEVYEVNQETGVTASLGQRIADGLSYSAKGLVSGAQNLLVWISYHIFGVVAAALILTPVIVISIRQLKKEKNPRQNSSGQK